MHPCLESYKFIQNNPKYREKIFIENFFLESHKKEFTRDCLKKHNIAGICLDFSHLATEKELCDEDYKRTCEIINLYPIGCNHISGFESGFLKKLFKLGEKISLHRCRDNSQLDYLKQFPASYFSPYLSIELENSFAEQLEFKKYIEEILKTIAGWFIGCFAKPRSIITRLFYFRSPRLQILPYFEVWKNLQSWFCGYLF